MKPIKAYIPNTITSLNLLSGCVAVIMAFNLDEPIAGLDGRYWAFIFIGAAAVFDFCDGLSARLLKAYSDMGKELDSLSDLVSFGVAPGMLMFNTMLAHGSALPWCICSLLIPLMGGLRLAKFNVDATQSTSFLGLPIPANAIFWIGFTAWVEAYVYPPSWVVAIIVLTFSLAMVCNIRMFSLKFKDLTLAHNIKRYVVLLAAVAFVAIYHISGFAWAIILYILISIFSRRHWSDEHY